MEANADMVHPTHQYLSQGVETVLEWSLKRHKHALHVRRQTIIVTLQNMFEQLSEKKLVSDKGVCVVYVCMCVVCVGGWVGWGGSR